MSDNRPIGIFDSGLGGLTVAAELKRRLPTEDLIYLGDNARVPYGSKSKETIVRFAIQDAEFLIRREVKCVVIACNSVSSLALPDLQKAFPDMAFVGVVEAGVARVLEVGAKHVLLIGTAATVNSDSYRIQIHRHSPDVNVRSLACPLFVPLVEEGVLDGELADLVIRHYLDPELISTPDALVLGCTHYPLLRKAIESLLPKSTVVVDSATACAAAVESRLIQTDRLAVRKGVGEERFFVTDMPASFFAMAERFLGRSPKHVDKVTVP